MGHAARTCLSFLCAGAMLLFGGISERTMRADDVLMDLPLVPPER